ncbi:MAG TPA: protein kinase [Anaerolineales bacterium]|nr:protein kinase [Anaerolineales bacterium]
MADWAGKTLGKVLIHELIARGGVAEVYTGTHETRGQVAIKVMRALLERDSDQLARFHREAEVIESLRHPNIVRMYDYDIVDESPYLIMEYIPGPSLAVYLKSLHDNGQHLSIESVAHILKAIANALDYAHLKGLVHRDIKPANVLLRSPYKPIELGQPLPPGVEPILTDFGLVRLLDSTMLTTSGSVSGTPTYMSPEQARGEKVDKRTDIYSLGILLYEMLAGTIPFKADTTFGMLMKHINEPPPPIKGISPDLQALVDRTLAKDPALRYDSAGDMANEFVAIFSGQTISPGTLRLAQLARQTTEASQQANSQPRESRSWRWLRVGIEIIIAIALAVVIGQFIGRGQQTAEATPPALDPNTPVGRIRFSDFNFFMDRVSITLNNNVPSPEEGTHYETWLITDDGQTARKIGPLTYGSSGVGRLEFNNPSQDNLLRNYSEIQITKEQNGASITSPTGEVLFSAVFPPQALKHIRYVIVSYDKTPDQGPLMQNLWYYSGEYIDKSINGDDLDAEYLGMTQALEANNETVLRKRTEEVINQIVGDQSGQYLDYDGNGIVDNPGDGYGSLANGEDRLGYLQETAEHVKAAAEAPDSTSNIRTSGENVLVCIENMNGWTNEILQLALQLNEMPMGPDMESIVSQLSVLGDKLVHGVDTDGNGSIDPLTGECGADTAYEHAYLMTDMSVYLGPDRILPSGK